MLNLQLALEPLKWSGTWVPEVESYITIRLDGAGVLTIQGPGNCWPVITPPLNGTGVAIPYYRSLTGDGEEVTKNFVLTVTPSGRERVITLHDRWRMKIGDNWSSRLETDFFGEKKGVVKAAAPAPAKAATPEHTLEGPVVPPAATGDPVADPV